MFQHHLTTPVWLYKNEEHRDNVICVPSWGYILNMENFLILPSGKNVASLRKELGVLTCTMVNLVVHFALFALLFDNKPIYNVKSIVMTLGIK